jgi:tetratricopeptide (TPR) repeat protein
MKSLRLFIAFLLLTNCLFAQDALRNICTDNTVEGINTSIDFYKKRLEHNADDQRALYCLGMSYYSLNQQKTAIEYFDKLICLNPKYPGALSNRGIGKYFLKDMVGACQDFQQSIKQGENPKVMDGKKLSAFVKKECKNVN